MTSTGLDAAHTPEAAAAPVPARGSGRVAAALGLLLLVFAYLAFAVVVLNQMYTGDTASGPLYDQALWSLHLSAFVGFGALFLPGSVLDSAWRRRMVVVQYVLACAGPALAAVDFA